VFDCGKLDIQDITPYQLTRADIATNVMSVPCFLIAHPRGTLMWDVGVGITSAMRTCLRAPDGSSHRQSAA
jgi:hypothetical protein